MNDLEAGLPPRVVAQALNERLGEGVVWCDGGAYDDYWLRRLYAAAAAEPTFVLGDWRGLLRGFEPPARERVLAALEAQPPPHRAGADAERLVKALAKGLGVPAISS